ncbi:MAG: translation initiation factor [Myxococcota bacterium]
MAKKARRAKQAGDAPGTKRVATEPAPALTQSPFAALLGADAPRATAVAEAPAAATTADAARSKAFPGKVVVRRETKGRGGKTVTRISGIAEAHRAPLTARLKKSLGCGATQEGEDVVLLGALVARAADWLEAEGARRVVRAN